MFRRIVSHAFAVLALMVVFATMSARAAAQTASWIAPVATAGGTATNQWNTTSNWSTGSVPNAAGAVVTFSGSYQPGVNNVQLLGSSTTTIGTLNMTSLSANGKLNFAATSGTAFLRLDSGSAVQPVINYTNGSQFDNFMNVSLVGTQGFEKTGGGVVQLGLANTYTGTTRISGGGVRFGNNSQLGDPSANIALNGGTLYMRTNSGSVALDNRTAFVNAPGATPRNMFVTSTAAAGSRLQVESGSLLEITGSISSVANAMLRKTDVGTLNIRGAGNVFGGAIEFDGGTTNISGGATASQNFVITKTNTTAAVTLNWSGTGSASGTYLILNDIGTGASNGILNVTSGSLGVGNGVANTRFVIGGKGLGSATISGGTVAVQANSDVSVGSFLQYGGNNGNGSLTISGGLLRANGAGNFFVGYGQDALTAGGAFGGKGVLSLNAGGVLETGRSIRSGTLASGTFNFNGGTLRTSANQSVLLSVTTANVGDGGAVIDTNGFGATIGQSLLASGTGGLSKLGAGVLTLSGSNGYAGSTAVNAGTLKAGNVNAFGAGAVTVASGATLDLDSLGVANSITNNGGTVSNAASYAGSQTLTGSSTFGNLGGTVTVDNGGVAAFTGAMSGGVTVNGGGIATVASSGSVAGGVSVAATGLLGGSGIVGAISGAGLVGPGNSPGILTSTGSLDPSGGLDFSFEFGSTSPTWSAASASVNDVLHLTAATPMTAALSGSNTVNVYLNAGALTAGNTFLGGIFIDQASGDLNLNTLVASAVFEYFVAGGSDVTYNGVGYSTLANYMTANPGVTGISASTVTVASADFATGTVTNGQAMQFAIVPEPGAMVLVATGALAAGWAAVRRIRRR